MKHYQIKQFQKGITLIESLVALLVLSIGLLGTAHLMATGIKHSNGSYARTQATYYAESIAERMRANPNAISSGFEYHDKKSSTTDCTTPPATFCATKHGTSTEATTCTAPQLATFDMFQISCGLDGATGLKADLPSGSASITCNDSPCTASSTYTIDVRWLETEAKNGSDVLNNKLGVKYVVLP